MSKNKGLFDSESSDSDLEDEPKSAPQKTVKKKKVVKKKPEKEVKKVEKKEGGVGFNIMVKDCEEKGLRKSLGG